MGGVAQRPAVAPHSARSPRGRASPSNSKPLAWEDQIWNTLAEKRELLFGCLYAEEPFVVDEPGQPPRLRGRDGHAIDAGGPPAGRRTDTRRAAWIAQLHETLHRHLLLLLLITAHA